MKDASLSYISSVVFVGINARIALLEIRNDMLYQFNSDSKLDYLLFKVLSVQEIRLGGLEWH